jgi:hypothetical protein
MFHYVRGVTAAVSRLLENIGGESDVFLFYYFFVGGGSIFLQQPISGA